MINNIEGKSKDIIKVLLGVNIIFLIFPFIYSVGKGLMISLTLINIVFIISFFTINKYVEYFGAMVEAQRPARFLNNLLGVMKK